MHWIYPSIGGVFFGFGLGSISDAALTLVIDSYREVCSLRDISTLSSLILGPSD